MGTPYLIAPSPLFIYPGFFSKHLVKRFLKVIDELFWSRRGGSVSPDGGKRDILSDVCTTGHLRMGSSAVSGVHASTGARIHAPTGCRPQTNRKTENVPGTFTECSERRFCDSAISRISLLPEGVHQGTKDAGLVFSLRICGARPQASEHT
jgi:hypothetical protein